MTAGASPTTLAGEPTSRRSLQLLIVSDLWPPHVIGGYELGAHDVARRLEARGHRVTVLTSTFGVGAPTVDGNVHRLLFEEVYPRPWRTAEVLAETVRSAAGLRRARRFLAGGRWDVVYLFNPQGLSAAVIEALRARGRPVVAYVSDDWIARWPRCDPLLDRWTRPYPGWPAWRRAALAGGRRAVAALGLMPRGSTAPVDHAQYVSRHIETLSAPVVSPASAVVIPWGIALPLFPFRARRADELARWAYVGQLEEHKGPQIPIAAIAELRRRGHEVSLTLYGRDNTPFASRLRAEVARAGLEPHVRFAGALPRETLWQEVQRSAGLLVFATLREEPFSLTVIEAFASGIPVVTTLTGGTGELVRDGENATVFRTGDVAHLVERWEALVRAPEQALAATARARAAVEERHDIERMVDGVEADLQRAHARSTALPLNRRSRS